MREKPTPIICFPSRSTTSNLLSKCSTNDGAPARNEGRKPWGTDDTAVGGGELMVWCMASGLHCSVWTSSGRGRLRKGHPHCGRVTYGLVRDDKIVLLAHARSWVLQVTIPYILNGTMTLPLGGVCVGLPSSTTGVSGTADRNMALRQK